MVECSDFAPVSGKEFIDIQVTIECEFTLKLVRVYDKNIQLENRAV